MSCAAGCLASLLLASTLPAQTPAGLRGLSQQFEDLVDRVDPAVVQILTRGFAPQEESSAGASLLRAQRGSGSGVIVDAEGYILTNAHVVGLARRVHVLVPQPAEDKTRHHSVLKPTGKLVEARVVGFDRETDIAVLKVDGKGLAHLLLGESERLRQGQIVFAFGSPFGLDNSVTMGVISSVARQVRPDDPMVYIQTDAAINPGNSGGPLVNTEGEVVGINTFILSQTGGNNGIGFAVPSGIVRTVYEQIRKEGRVRRGQLGVLAQTITPALAQALSLGQDWGVVINDVAPGGAAESGGIEVGDVILTLDGKVMENARQMGVNIYQRAGQVVEIELLRGRQKLTKKVSVLERPRDPDRILTLIAGDGNLIPRLGILALPLDEKVFPLLPPLRKLAGVVVAGVVANVATQEEPFHPGDVIYAVNNERVTSVEQLKKVMDAFRHGQPVAVQIERLGQLQYLLLEVE